MSARLCVVCAGPLSGQQRRFDKPECQKAQARADWILKTYGLTLAQWDKIWEHQGRKCAICGRAPREGETYHLDHEHTSKQSGVCRGILCPYCNTRLVGRLKSAELAQKLATYLATPPAVAALGGQVIAPGRPPRKRKPRRRRGS